MATNLAIDDKLLLTAQRMGRQKTKKATVMEALKEYIQRRKQRQVISLFGTIHYDPTFAYKQQRKRA